MDEVGDSSKISELYIWPCLIDLNTTLFPLRLVLLLVTLSISSTSSSKTLILEIFNGRNDSHLVTFLVKVAITDEEKAIGLSNHFSLPEKEGLLFIFDKAKSVKIWTRFMNFPIDIIFIDEKGRISRIYRSALPGSDKIFGSYSPSRFVLELNSGAAERFNIKKDDYIIPENILFK